MAPFCRSKIAVALISLLEDTEVALPPALCINTLRIIRQFVEMENPTTTKPCMVWDNAWHKYAKVIDESVPLVMFRACC